ncbi:MAG: hypothetical protein R3B90_02315 [Planctomycetaceae bacterium]
MDNTVFEIPQDCGPTGKVDIAYTLTNDSSKPIVLRGMNLFCDCANAGLRTPVEVAAGDAMSIPVKIHCGRIDHSPFKVGTAYVEADSLMTIDLYVERPSQ